MDSSRRVVIMRRACLMEDEGRDQYIAIRETKQEAEEWIAKQKGAYFSPSDYYIMERPDGR